MYVCMSVCKIPWKCRNLATSNFTDPQIIPHYIFGILLGMTEGK